MFPWIGVAGSALSLLNTVLKSGTASGTAQTGNNLFSSLGQTLTGNSSGQANAVVGSGQAAPTLSSGTLSTLIAMQGQDGANGQGGIFARLDTNGDGSISKTEFETAAKNAGLDTSSADGLFGKLDANGDGSISKGEMAKATHHGHHHGGGMRGLAQAMNSDAAGATTKTTANADGSSTTTITYQDGGTVTMTTPASGSSGGTNQANLIEKLIKLQAQIAGSSSSSATASTTA